MENAVLPMGGPGTLKGVIVESVHSPGCTEIMSWT